MCILVLTVQACSNVCPVATSCVWFFVWYTVWSLCSLHIHIQALQRELAAYQESTDEANAIGSHLIAEVLDDPSVTQSDLSQLNEAWENVCQSAVAKQERLDEAYQAAKDFDDEYKELVGWVTDLSAQLQAMPPPDEDSTVLQQQMDEHKVCTSYM